MKLIHQEEDIKRRERFNIETGEQNIFHLIDEYLA